jgi:hypothetical protein
MSYEVEMKFPLNDTKHFVPIIAGSGCGGVGDSKRTSIAISIIRHETFGSRTKRFG